MGKKYYMVEEDRHRAHRQELIIAESYDEAFKAYVKQIVKPMRKHHVLISRVTKKMAKHIDAPIAVKAKSYELKEKEREFSISYKNEKAKTITANSFEDAVEKFKDGKKKFDIYELEIRIKKKNEYKYIQHLPGNTYC